MIPAMQEMQKTQIQFLEWEGPWRRKWQLTPVFLPGKFHGVEELGGLQSMGLQRVRYTHTHRGRQS